MNEAGPVRPRTRIQREKQDQILGAALEVFSREGFRGATIVWGVVLLGCERGATRHASDSVSASGSHARATAPTGTLPCLRPESLRTAADTLRYSSLSVHEETGDQLGVELGLARSGGGWGGRIALAQGELGAAARLRDARVDEQTGEAALAWDYAGRPATFRGTITCAAVRGEFRWAPDAPPEVDTLPRHRAPAG